MIGAAFGLSASQSSNAHAMVAEVHRRGLPKRAAVIVLETAIVESGIRVYANSNVGASLGITHEAVGSDHLSVGPLQQQVPSWGAVADCMDPARSAGKFLAGAGTNPGLLTLPAYRFAYVGYPSATNWAQIPTGAAAQAVQVSAFPDRYQQQEAQALALVNEIWPLLTPKPVTKPTEDRMIIWQASDADQAFYVVEGGRITKYPKPARGQVGGHQIAAADVGRTSTPDRTISTSRIRWNATRYVKTNWK